MNRASLLDLKSRLIHGDTFRKADHLMVDAGLVSDDAEVRIISALIAVIVGDKEDKDRFCFAVMTLLCEAENYSKLLPHSQYDFAEAASFVPIEICASDKFFCALRHALKSENRFTRINASHAISRSAKLLPTDAIQLLKNLADDEDDLVRENAHNGLMGIAGKD